MNLKLLSDYLRFGFLSARCRSDKHVRAIDTLVGLDIRKRPKARSVVVLRIKSADEAVCRAGIGKTVGRKTVTVIADVIRLIV